MNSHPDFMFREDSSVVFLDKNLELSLEEHITVSVL